MPQAAHRRAGAAATTLRSPGRGRAAGRGAITPQNQRFKLQCESDRTDPGAGPAIAPTLALHEHWPDPGSKAADGACGRTPGIPARGPTGRRLQGLRHWGDMAGQTGVRTSGSFSPETARQAPETAERRTLAGNLPRVAGRDSRGGPWRAWWRPLASWPPCGRCGPSRPPVPPCSVRTSWGRRCRPCARPSPVRRALTGSQGPLPPGMSSAAERALPSADVAWLAGPSPPPSSETPPLTSLGGRQRRRRPSFRYAVGRKSRRVHVRKSCRPSGRAGELPLPRASTSTPPVPQERRSRWCRPSPPLSCAGFSWRPTPRSLLAAPRRGRAASGRASQVRGRSSPSPRRAWACATCASCSW